jgi:hypothetical protein
LTNRQIGELFGNLSYAAVAEMSWIKLWPHMSASFISPQTGPRVGTGPLCRSRREPHSLSLRR